MKCAKCGIPVNLQIFNIKVLLKLKLLMVSKIQIFNDFLKFEFLKSFNFKFLTIF